MGHTRRVFLQAVAGGSALASSSVVSGAASSLAQATGQVTQPAPKPPSFARALDFEESVIYRPAVRPGYVCWVAPWRGPDGSLFLGFAERRKLPNPAHQSIPLDFWESIGIPIKYQSQYCSDPHILPENVVLQSRDEAKTWQEVGRDTSFCVHHFARLSLPDGTMLRGAENAFLAYRPTDKQACLVQSSTDGGNTWKEYSTVLDDCFSYPYRMMMLQDGVLALLAKYDQSFGPGRTKARRTGAPDNVRLPTQAVIFHSYDQGRSWEGPTTVLPGVAAWEPDWVELPSGDLLLVNSDIQGGASTRQIVRRQGKHFVPQFVMDIAQGPVPENFLLTPEGLLVGSRRGGVYSCSKDLGNTWYAIAGLPNALYQPRILQLTDGRLCNIFHFGGDNFVGEVDQFIGQHVFRLEEHLPQPTRVTLARQRNPQGTQYVNAYVATLTAGEEPLPEQEIKFTVRASTRNRRRYVTEEFRRRTDVEGRARLSLLDFDKCLDIHRDYTVQAEFLPASGDTRLAKAVSTKYETYRMNPTAGKKNTYAFYVAGQTLFVWPEMLAEFPEVEALVKKFGLKPGFTAAEAQKALRISPSRWNKLAETLAGHHVLRRDSRGVCRWNEVELTEVRPITIEDDFV